MTNSFSASTVRPQKPNWSIFKRDPPAIVSVALSENTTMLVRIKMLKNIFIYLVQKEFKINSNLTQNKTRGSICLVEIS